jgi:hypothetical protein
VQSDLRFSDIYPLDRFDEARLQYCADTFPDVPLKILLAPNALNKLSSDGKSIKELETELSVKISRVVVKALNE